MAAMFDLYSDRVIQNSRYEAVIPLYFLFSSSATDDFSSAIMDFLGRANCLIERVS